MCRAKSQGGRRCRCKDGGAQRRAAARARYAARIAEAARQAANTPHFSRRSELAEADMLLALGGEVPSEAEPIPAVEESSSEATPAPAERYAEPDPAIELFYTQPVSELSDDQREVLTAYAVARGRRARVEALSAFRAVSEDAAVYTDTPTRRAYEAALIEQGRHLSALVDLEIWAARESLDAHTREGCKQLSHEMVTAAGFVDETGEPLSHVQFLRQTSAGLRPRKDLEDFAKLYKQIYELEDESKLKIRRAHADATRAALLRMDPELTFGAADLNAGEHPVTWGTGMTKKRQSQFVDALSSVYPDQLVEHGRDSGNPLRVRVTKGRAHYQVTGAYERLPTQHFVDTVDLLSSMREGKDSGLTDEQLQMRFRYATRHVVRKGSVPDVGVRDTPQNRELLEQVVQGWSAGDSWIARSFLTRMGSNPTLVAEGGKLYLATNKRTESFSGAAVSELTTDGSVSTTVHEMAHRIEDQTPAIAAACHAFLARRTAGLEQTIYNISTRNGRRVVEKVTEDSFVNSYVGKDYGKTCPATEVLSMGMEALASGDFGGLTGDDLAGWSNAQYRADPEHRQLVLALLATAPATLPPNASSNS